MIEKIKNLFAKMPHGIIPFVVVIALLFVCILIGLISNSSLALTSSIGVPIINSLINLTVFLTSSKLTP